MRSGNGCAVTGCKRRPETGDVDLINRQRMDRDLMARIITTYLIVVLLVSLGFFGVGALASAQQSIEPMPTPYVSLQ